MYKIFFILATINIQSVSAIRNLTLKESITVESTLSLTNDFDTIGFKSLDLIIFIVLMYNTYSDY